MFTAIIWDYKWVQIFIYNWQPCPIILYSIFIFAKW